MYKLQNDAIKVPCFKESGGFYTTKQRSLAMAKVRKKNTFPELLLRKNLWVHNIRFRVNVKDLPGTPDIAIKKYKLVIFVDGKFWHGYEWDQAKRKLKSNRDFWIPKIERNIQRDKYNNALLADMGYTVFRFWDFQIIKDLAACVNQIQLYIEAAKYRRIPDPWKING